MKTNKKALLLSIKKAMGTLTKITSLIEDDAYCADIAQQINATIGLLRSANHQLLKDHLACCGREKLGSGDETQAANFIEEFVRVRAMSVRK